MDRERQTLELLQLLGDEVAEEVLGRLQPERAEKLRASLKSDRPLLSTISRQREVLDEFECFFQFALKSKPPEPVPYANGPDSATSDKLANAEDTAKDSAADSESSSAAEQKEAAELKANELNAAKFVAYGLAGSGTVASTQALDVTLDVPAAMPGTTYTSVVTASLVGTTP